LKKLFVIFYFLLGTTVYSQNRKFASLEISTRDCRTNENSSSFTRIDTISFYKLPADTLSFKISIEDFDTFPIELKDIFIGSYRIKYKNNFGQETIKKIEVYDNDSNFIGLCPDSLLEYKLNSLDKLINGDSITINYTSFGCFHGFAKILVIRKESNKLIARLYDAEASFITIKNETNLQFEKKEILKETLLTASNLLDFIRFENELDLIDGGGCTTTDWYEFNGKCFMLKKNDGTCRWRGFWFLSTSLFGEDAMTNWH
jgi:hypothetical protein